jgi:hypothetical protein
MRRGIGSMGRNRSKLRRTLLGFGRLYGGRPSWSSVDAFRGHWAKDVGVTSSATIAPLLFGLKACAK